MERGVLQGLAALRWVAWAWMAAVLVLTRDRVERPVLGAILVVLAFAVTAGATVLWRTRPETLLRPGPVLVELVVGLALVLCDGVVRQPGSAFGTGQSLGSVWPLVGVLSAGVALGSAPGAAAGAAMGLARVGSSLLNDAGAYDESRVLSLLNSVVLYAIGGAVAGYAWQRLQRAEREVAAVRAREEVSRTLHDGVLQTLALVERRAADPALARLARDQERDLRSYLSGSRSPIGGLAAALRGCADRFEEAFDAKVDVLVPDDIPSVRSEQVAALSGAVGEALTNAGKHGGAGHVVVYVEEDGDGGLFCSVKDDGAGFDPDAVTEGTGMARSIRARVEEAGGRAEVSSRPGEGAEVRLCLPR
jgi:signal transduction histidine kinase